MTRTRAVNTSATQTNTLVTGAQYTPTVAGVEYRLWCQVAMSAGATVSMSVTYTYKDQGGTARTDTFFLFGPTGNQPANSLIIAAGRYSGSVMIRTGAISAISIQTAGTVTSTTYVLESSIDEVQVP